jgi:hypothetical protein
MPFLRVARGELVPIRRELKTLLYAGVLVAVAGVGKFLKDYHERLGPVVIASALGLAALACLIYAFRRSAEFSWGETVSPHIAADYVLILGALLFGSDLAYIERQFNVFGERWPYHFLVVAAVYFVLAYRFDSRAVLSLALSAFATWRGVSVAVASGGPGERAVSGIRLNALACGLLFLAAAYFSIRTRRKPHFEKVYATTGLLLLFGGILSGVLQDSRSSWLFWETVLGVVGVAVLVIAWRLRRPLDFAIAVAALWLGVLRMTGEVLKREPLFLAGAVWSVAAIVVLVSATRRMRAAR